MKPEAHQHNRILFIGIGALHLAIGIGLLIGLPIQNVSSLASLVILLGREASAIVMIVIGTLAMCSMLVKNGLAGFGFLVAQQAVLIGSGAAGICCALSGQYADLTPAPPWHIFVDQLPYLVLTVQHSLAIIQTDAPKVWNRMWGCS